MLYEVITDGVGIWISDVETARIGYIGRINYSYANKYYSYNFV